MTNKDVALVIPKRYYPNERRYLQPLGVAYLHSTLTESEIFCDVLDLNHSDFSNYNKTVKIISNYRVVGFSVITDDLAYIKRITNDLKKINNKILVVIGGIHSTVNAEKMIKLSNIDVCIIGEAELVFKELVLDYLENNRINKSINGCYYKLNDDQVINKGINIIENLDILPFPTRFNLSIYESLVNIDELERIIHPIVSSRGCPYKCAFCSVASTNIKWRGRSPNNIALEIFSIYSNQKKIYIQYVDDNFFVDSKRAFEVITAVNMFCGEIIPFSFATRTDQLLKIDVLKLDWLYENGCRYIELGIENGDDNVLKRFNKNTTSYQNSEVLRLLRKTRIKIIPDYIMFDAFTSLLEIENNIEFLKENGLWGYYRPLIYNRIVAYPGTGLYNEYTKRRKYFKYYRINIFYKSIKIFQKMNQNIIDDCIEEVKITFRKQARSPKQECELIYLQTLPYIFFEKIFDVLNKNTISFLKIIKILFDFNVEVRKIKKIMSKGGNNVLFKL